MKEMGLGLVIHLGKEKGMGLAIMVNPRLYRRRIIPCECVELKDDIILTCNDDYILTSWNTLKPKVDLHHGYSCYWLKEGIKLSKLYRKDNSLICWYADIVDFVYQETENTLTTTDLLVDVIINPDGFVQVLDLDELAMALEDKLIDEETLKRSLRLVDSFLRVIYDGDLSKWQKPLEDASADETEETKE
ncbi:MAG: DUF402 domain-containing protein [Lachnospiraceae bacterium]|jgi:hypothetical protein|nr:DUF402 domain-containing protein [Lachnospiraceae bacterium]